MGAWRILGWKWGVGRLSPAQNLPSLQSLGFSCFVVFSKVLVVIDWYLDRFRAVDQEAGGNISSSKSCRLAKQRFGNVLNVFSLYWLISWEILGWRCGRGSSPTQNLPCLQRYGFSFFIAMHWYFQMVLVSIEYTLGDVGLEWGRVSSSPAQNLRGLQS